jgi:hypothetical protein
MYAITTSKAANKIRYVSSEILAEKCLASSVEKFTVNPAT